MSGGAMLLGSSPLAANASVSSSSLRSQALHRVRASSNLVQVTTGLQELSHNQVLTSAILGSVTAQCLKPFSSLVAGKGFNWRLVLKSGGMPSSHTAGVVAAAMAVGLERGLSDSVFGLSLVVAGIVMYDAQGVRRAVGKQAEVLNTMVFTYGARGSQINSFKSSSTRSRFQVPVTATRNYSVDSRDPSEDGSYERSTGFFETAETLPSMKSGEVFLEEIGNQEGWRHIPLKESVGHTKLEVFAGAILGVVLTIALHS